MDARVVWIRVRNNNALMVASLPDGAERGIEITNKVVTNGGIVRLVEEVDLCTLEEISAPDWREFQVPGDSPDEAVEYARQHFQELLRSTIRFGF